MTPTPETLKLLKADIMRARSYDAAHPPKVVQVAYSGGKASQMLLEMILRGEIATPAGARLIVTCANPGMENPKTYETTARMEARCKAAGIPFLRADKNLYAGLLAAKHSGATRFDFLAFFTKDRETGKIGMMNQRCTKEFKIAPMDRLARHWMDANLGISKKSKRIGNKIICKWIGFTYDEATRIKPHKCAKYVCFDYPLVNMKITESKMFAWYAENGIEMPPRSVCNACFANDEQYFKAMYENFIDGIDKVSWLQAVAIDQEIRDLSQFGMRDECFVYAGCIPLTELAARGFPKLTGKKQEKCHTGHCFI